MQISQFFPLDFIEYPQEQMLKKSEQFFKDLKRRRSVRDFSDNKVPQKIIENCIKTAAAAPSGANKQPWHFVVVESPEVKKQIRIEAEKTENEFYAKKAPKEWLDSLNHLGIECKKFFLEQAPFLIVVFSERFRILKSGEIEKNYYVTESAGIAVGFLIAAIHNAGLVTVPYTPAPMNFLNEILKRPENERGFCILPVGYPAEKVKVPKIKRKKLKEISNFM